MRSRTPARFAADFFGQIFGEIRGEIRGEIFGRGHWPASETPDSATRQEHNSFTEQAGQLAPGVNIEATVLRHFIMCFSPGEHKYGPSLPSVFPRHPTIVIHKWPPSTRPSRRQ